MSARYVSFAGNTVVVKYKKDADRQLLDDLFGDVDSLADSRPLSRFRISQSDSGKVRLKQDGVKVYSGNCRITLATTLVQKMLYTLIDRDDSGLALHAAAVCGNTTGVLIPGQSGAGKSTLATWLATRGFNYLTDELVHVPLGSTTIEAFTRPINLKRNDCLRPEEELNIEDPRGEILKSRRVYIVPHRLANPVYRKLKPDIGVILFPHLTEAGGHRLEPISKAQSVLKLAECLVNGRNIPNCGFDEISRIARDIPAYVLHYYGFKTLPRLLEGILP